MIKKGKAISIQALIDFCDSYNAIGYGTANIIELEHKFVVKLYNAGYSENESMDIEFRKLYRTNIILDYHPITIAEFSKLNLIWNNHIVDFEKVVWNQDYYSKQREFKHILKLS